eukprot:TRINITY_DN7289_c0_g2_i1.p1 TRINITY_DN7289_c0_g2~~TRINITY_DN7289_c0_g2_i1.p1  ORF type:complete len:526 (+),score=35.20 TRINITY_DN7289_c0_g2_i1:83-1660(+)
MLLFLSIRVYSSVQSCDGSRRFSSSLPPMQDDYLGALANRQAEKGCRPARRGGRTVGRRLSAEDLRARGVDESFLKPAESVDGGDIEITKVTQDVDSAVSFVVGTAITHVDGQVTHGLGVDGPRPSFGTRAPKAEEQAELTATELQEEYGVGYSLLVRMGYAGGGRVPLAAVKRLPRVALQDNEEAALDHSAPIDTKRKRRRLYATAADTDGLQVILDNSEEGRLQRAILMSLKKKGRLSLADLSQQPAVRSALASRPEVGQKLQAFIRRFLRTHIPQCRMLRSTTSDWYKLSGGVSSTKWRDESKRACIVLLRESTDDATSASSEGSDGSSSSDSDTKREATPEVDWDTIDSVGTPAVEVPTCHGCQQTFPSRVALRTHLAEKLSTRTTDDPTDLRLPFDEYHRDRTALGMAAVPFASSGAKWHCPVCRATNTLASFPSFTSLLEHAVTEPGHRAQHQRLLNVVAELLIREPPPRLSLKQGAQTSWCSSGLQPLFQALLDESSESYTVLADSVLGPEHDDMFSC